MHAKILQHSDRLCVTAKYTLHRLHVYNISLSSYEVQLTQMNQQGSESADEVLVGIERIA